MSLPASFGDRGDSSVFHCNRTDQERCELFDTLEGARYQKKFLRFLYTYVIEQR